MLQSDKLKAACGRGGVSVSVLACLTILSLILFLPGSVLAHDVQCGDANRDNAIDLGDVVYIVTFVFKGGPPPEFLCDSDVNNDGGTNVGDAVWLINWIFKSGPGPACPSGGNLANTTGCKLFSGNKGAASESPDQECLEYDYDGQGLLILKHINAGFNCCPGEISVDIAVGENTIVLKEDERFAGCDCLCLFDLDLEIHNLEPGEYTIQIDNPYYYPNEDPLVVTLDLTQPASGTFCVPRSQYPWGVYSSPSGGVIDFGTCKYLEGGEKSGNTPPDQDCVFFEYDGAGVLDITHVNGAFNCCSQELLGEFSFEGNTIIITEDEIADPPCYCLCLYDVDYRITGISPGVYVLRVLGMNLGDQAPIEFTIDLSSETSGSYCVTRTWYPWF